MTGMGLALSPYSLALSLDLIARPETIQEVLFNGIRALGATGSYTHARLEAELLLAHALGTTRTYLLARLGEPLDANIAAHFAAMVARRAKHEPLAYILGHQEFYGLDFVVDRRVLIPRPETELLVERALDILEHAPWLEPAIADIGTGSGAIIISIATRVARGRFIAVDISHEALEIARINAERLSVAPRIEFCEGDLVDPLREPVDLLVANLPYIPLGRAKELPLEIRHFEPRMATIAGLEGLSQVRRLLSSVSGKLARGARILLEISEEQGKDALELARARFPLAEIELHQDLEGLDRLIEIRT